MSRQPGTQGSSGGRRNLPFRPSGSGGSGGGPGGRGDLTCHQCGNIGHIAKNCPHQGNARPSGSGGGGGGPGGRGDLTCHQCGNIGHIAKNCPHQKNAGADYREGRGVRPLNKGVRPGGPLPPISGALANESTIENKLVQKFEGVNRTAESKPYRPSYGIKGDAVEFRTNYFPVSLPDKLVLHRYSIKIDVDYDEGKQLPEPKNKKLKRIIRLLVDGLDNSKLRVPIATDFKSTLVCGGMIPQSLWVRKIKYSHEDDRGTRNGSRTYTVRIEETSPLLPISELKTFLASTTVIAPFSHRESMLQALNIIFGHHAKSNPIISIVGGNKAFNNEKNELAEKVALGDGLEAIRGYFLSVRLATLRTIVNVNVCHGAFYEAIPLRELINERTGNPYDWDDVKYDELETFLKGVKVKTNYLKEGRITQVRSIQSFASTSDGEGTKHPPKVEYNAAPPRRVFFYLDDEKDIEDVTKQMSKSKDNRNRVKGKYISVAVFFEKEYHIKSDEGERYPVLNFGSRKDPIYVPAEACSVEPGQLAKLKLNPNQVTGMKSFAIREPPATAASINEKGLPILGLWPTEASLVRVLTLEVLDLYTDSSQRGFEIEIDNRMVAVQGRMLTRPSVLYKNETPAAEAKGGWNLQGRKFKKPVPNTNGRLSKWGCLILQYPRDKSSYDLAITKFQKSLEACGIETDRPSTDRSEFDPKKRDFFHTRNGLNLHGTIKQICQPDKPYILLVILPEKNTALYNTIKKLCDQTEGIHTVCVVKSGFLKTTLTYLANVTLKFNLKLGGINHTLGVVDMGIISKGRTMVVGIDVVHPSPGSGKASVASMVASIDEHLAQWPVDLRVQVREGQEMLDKIDVMLESRLTLWRKRNKVYPENILVYRDGVSESQYQQVLDEELARMRGSCAALYDDVGEPRPRFTLIIVGKRHHTRFFPPAGHPRSDNGNPERGLVVDRGITEARNWDFFLQSHDAIKGTARPAHYYVLWDEIFTNPDLRSEHDAVEPGIPPADRLEKLSHSLCYMFSRAAMAVSIPAPVYYADIACTRAGRYLAEPPTGSQSTTSGNTELTAAQREHLCAELQAKIKVHDDLRDSMFYV